MTVWIVESHRGHGESPKIDGVFLSRELADTYLQAKGVRRDEEDGGMTDGQRWYAISEHTVIEPMPRVTVS